MLVAFHLIAGLVLLVCGAELVVKGAVRIATLAKVSSLVVGLTVVAYGTSAPEMAVCAKASIAGETDIALGNAVGANLLNVLLILGVSAMAGPLVVAGQLVKVELPVMIGASFALWLIALTGTMQRWHGLLLVLSLVVYTALAVRWSRRQTLSNTKDKAVEQTGLDSPGRRTGLAWHIIYICFVPLGIALLVAGSDLLVRGAVQLAALLGVSEVVIGLTVVAMGTTAPEMATSVMASVRGHRDIAVGNVVGSNMCNIMVVLGVAAVVGQEGVAIPDSTARFDIPLMVGVAALCLPLFVSGMVITRLEGVFLVLCYVAYTVYHILAARNPELALDIRWFVLAVMLPGIAVWTLVVLRKRREQLRNI
jgi:cation:H+ antiporter